MNLLDFLNNFKRKRRVDAAQLSVTNPVEQPDEPTTGDDAGQIPAAARYDAVMNASEEGRPRLASSTPAPDVSSIPPEVIADINSRMAASSAAQPVETPDIAGGQSPLMRATKPYETITNEAGESVAPISGATSAGRARFDKPPTVRYDSKGRPQGVSMHAPDKVAAEQDVNQAIRDYQPQKAGAKEFLKHTLGSFLGGYSRHGSLMEGVGSAAGTALIDTFDREAPDKTWQQVALGQSDARLNDNLQREAAKAKIEAIRSKPHDEQYKRDEAERDNLRQTYNQLPNFDPDNNPEHAQIAARARALHLTLPKRDEKDQTALVKSNGRYYLVDKRRKSAIPVDDVPVNEGDVPKTINVNGIDFTVPQSVGASAVAQAANSSARTETEAAQADVTNSEIESSLSQINKDIEWRRNRINEIVAANNGKRPEYRDDPGFDEYQRVAGELTRLEDDQRDLKTKRKAKPAPAPSVKVAPTNDPFGIRRQ
jgi:hypothetical protein